MNERIIGAAHGGRLQSGRIGKVLEPLGQAKHLQLAFSYCGEERVRSVFGHDPNERPEPAPFAFFDFTGGIVGLPCERRHAFWGDPSGGEALPDLVAVASKRHVEKLIEAERKKAAKR